MTHGTLPFFEGGYAQAFDLAKRDLRYLVVVLLSPEHDDNSIFVRDTLLAPEFVAFVNDPSNNVTLWAGTSAEQVVTSSTNTFADLLPGVSVTVTAASPDPVTLTVARDGAASEGGAWHGARLYP